MTVYFIVGFSYLICECGDEIRTEIMVGSVMVWLKRDGGCPVSGCRRAARVPRFSATRACLTVAGTSQSRPGNDTLDINDVFIVRRSRGRPLPTGTNPFLRSFRK